MTPDPSLYVNWNYNDKRLWKIRMECKPKWNKIKIK